MIKEAIEFLRDELRKREPSTTKVHTTTTDETYLVDFGGMKAPEFKKFELDVFKRNHSFTTLESFGDYLSSRHCERDHGIIFVNDNQVFARLNYEEPGTLEHVAILPLVKSEEWKALAQLGNGVDQKTLWRLLSTALFDRVDVELLVSISTLSIAIKADAAASINALGITNTKGGREIVLEHNKPKSNEPTTTKIRQEWEFEVKIWACFNQRFKIKTVLEIDLDDGAKFIFRAQALEEVLAKAKLELVQAIGAGVPSERFTVHEGSY